MEGGVRARIGAKIVVLEDKYGLRKGHIATIVGEQTGVQQETWKLDVGPFIQKAQEGASWEVMRATDIKTTANPAGISSGQREASAFAVAEVILLEGGEGGMSMMHLGGALGRRHLAHHLTGTSLKKFLQTWHDHFRLESVKGSNHELHVRVTSRTVSLLKEKGVNGVAGETPRKRAREAEVNPRSAKQSRRENPATSLTEPATGMGDAAFSAAEDTADGALEFANVNATDRFGYSRLAFACRRGYKSLAESLVGQGADIEQATRRGKTPLMLAAAVGCDGLVEFLLEFGADPTPVDAGGQSARQLAEKLYQVSGLGRDTVNRLRVFDAEDPDEAVDSE